MIARAWRRVRYAGRSRGALWGALPDQRQITPQVRVVIKLDITGLVAFGKAMRRMGERLTTAELGVTVMARRQRERATRARAAELTGGVQSPYRRNEPGPLTLRTAQAMFDRSYTDG